MVCLAPDGRVRICRVPHGRDPPSMNSLAGALPLGGGTLIQYTPNLKQDLMANFVGKFEFIYYLITTVRIGKKYM